MRQLGAAEGGLLGRQRGGRVVVLGVDHRRRRRVGARRRRRRLVARAVRVLAVLAALRIEGAVLFLEVGQQELVAPAVGPAEGAALRRCGESGVTPPT